jgi:inorganic pyrophosphatase
MVTPVHDLPAVDHDSCRVNVVVDTPQGSRNKYKFDEQHGQWRLSKVLPQGMRFPYDFGFIPSTRGEEGDPVDVLLLMDEPAFPGCVVPARLIGVLEAEQTEDSKTVRNDRFVAVVETPYNPAEFHALEEVSRQRLDEPTRWKGGSSSRLPAEGPTALRNSWNKQQGAPAPEAMVRGALEAGARNEKTSGGSQVESPPDVREALPCPLN